MIKFVTGSDQIETDELDGKIVLQVAIEDWPAYKHPCKVIQKTDNSVIVERLHANYDDDLRCWLFTDRTAGEQQVIRLSLVKAVCDTAQEANEIIRRSRDAIDNYHRLRDMLVAGFSELASDSMDTRTANADGLGCKQG